jgi:hypothetical protein
LKCTLFIAVFGRKIKKHFYKNVLNIMRCFSVIQVAGQFSTMLALRQASPLPPSWPFCRPAGPLPPSWPFAAVDHNTDGFSSKLPATAKTIYLPSSSVAAMLTGWPYAGCNSRHCVTEGALAFTTAAVSIILSQVEAHNILTANIITNPAAFAW